MNWAAKDSPEVIEFRTLFARLRQSCGNMPSELETLARDDASIRELCSSLGLTSAVLNMSNRRSRTLFTSPVDPEFLDDWRKYEESYQSVVGEIWLPISLPNTELRESSEQPTLDRLWEIADEGAKRDSRELSEVIWLARQDSEDDFLDDERREVLDGGVRAWDQLEENIGLDLRGVFRRREIVPFVLIPRGVAAKYGNSDKLSLLRSLQQAHDAFIFGAYHAAIALMRSIMEVVLKEHYGIRGGNIKGLIKEAQGRDLLPVGANATRLYRLLDLSNGLLHFNREKVRGLPPESEVARIEIEIVSFLYAIRSLIEGAE